HTKKDWSPSHSSEASRAKPPNTAGFHASTILACLLALLFVSPSVRTPRLPLGPWTSVGPPSSTLQQEALTAYCIIIIVWPVITFVYSSEQFFSFEDLLISSALFCDLRFTSEAVEVVRRILPCCGPRWRRSW
ncbi:hypothetical protein CSUI_003614, partial [Cystoisospora suis]